jgi:hypothetical protein
MSSSAPTFGQIRAQVSAIKRQPGHADARVFGIHSTVGYAGESRVTHGSDLFEIVQCDSELSMRAALQDTDDDVAAKVLVTGLSTDQLSTDVRVRLARRKLYPIKKWQIVRELFQARKLDPRIVDQHWIAESLLDLAPADNYPPVPGGVLDAETVWGILLEQKIGLPIVRPDLISLLKWSMESHNVRRYCSQSEEFKTAACVWLSQSSGVATAAVLSCLEKAQQPIPLTIGLALAVTSHSEARTDLKLSQVRIEERYVGQNKLTETVAEQWARAATNLVRLHLPDARLRSEWLQKGDELIRAVEAEPWAHVSRTSLIGFEQRLDGYGKAVSAAAESRVTAIPIAVNEAYEYIANHEQTNWQRGSRRLERVEMSARLLRWLANENKSSRTGFDSLVQAANWYGVDGGFVDWARYILQSGEPARKLAEAYNKLVTKVVEIRGQQNKRFAELVRDWTAAGGQGDDVLPVERVMSEFVAPLAGTAPLLVLVIDGMSFAVFREMVADITRQDWVEIRKSDRLPIWPGIATLPSVTEVSRTSLVCGELLQGSQSTEKSHFPKHPDLLYHSQTSHPPVLFHKKELQSRDETSLSDEVIKAIESTKQRVVGAVINAVDDFLAKGEQLDIRWDKDGIKVLPQLLYEAKSSGRMVVLLSDHGHILDRETKMDQNQGGERWRHTAEPKEGEIVIKGDRCVIPESHELIVPWSEKIRYSVKKNGYHGGVTMQEMLVPMAVLSARDDLPEGWVEPNSDVPSWWFEPMTRSLHVEMVGDDEQPVEIATPVGFLFDKHDMDTHKGSDPKEPAKTPEAAAEPKAAPATAPGWIETLLSSAVYQSQKAMAGRKPPEDELVGKLIFALDSHGGKLTSPALAVKVGVPAFRLPGTLAVVQRVLNVEGYSILTKDEASDSVELNRDLLFTQFEISTGDQS